MIRGLSDKNSPLARVSGIRVLFRGLPDGTETSLSGLLVKNISGLLWKNSSYW